MSGIFFVSANSRANCANFSGERRLLACCFRQLAETIFSESIPRNRIRCRQAAGNRRLAFCATQSLYLREETVASRNKGEPAFSFFRRIYSAKPENADRSATSPKSDPGAIVRSNTQVAEASRRIRDYPGPISVQASRKVGQKWSAPKTCSGHFRLNTTL